MNWKYVQFTDAVEPHNSEQQNSGKPRIKGQFLNDQLLNLQDSGKRHNIAIIMGDQTFRYCGVLLYCECWFLIIVFYFIWLDSFFSLAVSRGLRLYALLKNRNFAMIYFDPYVMCSLGEMLTDYCYFHELQIFSCMTRCKS